MNKYVSIALLIIAVAFVSCKTKTTTTTEQPATKPVVGLDNWFNKEVKRDSGNSYHYVWSDTEFSGYSQWGELFTSKGADIVSVAKPTSDALANIDVYIIVDPDTTTESQSPNYLLEDDIASIVKWVEDGGVLAVLANDAPNCEFTHLNQLMANFGMTFNHVSLHPVYNNDYEMAASVNLPQHPLFKDVSKIYTKEVSDIVLSKNAQAILEEDGKVLMAECNFGKGYVFAIGDPWIYNEYIDHALLPESFENLQAAKNLTDILLNKTRKVVS